MRLARQAPQSVLGAQRAVCQQPEPAVSLLRQDVVAARDAELAAGRSALAALQERAHGLELANYSLALHLRQAPGGGAAGGFGGGPRPPDVF